MRQDIKINAGIFPMPVLMIATYNDDGTVDCMALAWGTVIDRGIIALNISDGHKTFKNIMQRKAFTVSIADAKHVTEVDYLGTTSANDVSDKFERTHLTAVKSEHVDAPVIQEFPICMECEFVEYQGGDFGCGVIGKIVNMSADPSVLKEDGKVDISKVEAISYDCYTKGYYKVTERVADAWTEGKKLK